MERAESFLKDGLERSKTELLKSKLQLEHSLGLGPKPNAVPPGGAVDIAGPPRVVHIGWHPVAGFAGKWFAERTGLGRLITERVHRLPDPTQHWAVLVGEYVHQLWMDENLDVIYINEKVNREDWHTFEVGKTRFSDEALRQAGEMVIYSMRQARPAYNLLDNNCQNFATLLLDQIQVGAHRDFATAYSVYQRAVGAGTIDDLFVDDHPDEAKKKDEDGNDVEVETEKPATPPEGTTKLAQQVMDENTTTLDDHHALFHWH